MPRIMFACLCAVVLAVLPACGSGGQVTPGASVASTGSLSGDSATGESSSSESDSTSTSDTTPPQETSGTESARPPQGGQGALIVAGLPNGANLDGDGCLTIRFLDAASEVPAGLSLVVTAITFTRDDVSFGGSACPQETPVCRPGLVLTETGSDECFASVTTDGAPVGSKVKVRINATVDCTGGDVAACVRYQQLLESDKENSDGEFEVPEPNQPETTPTSEAPSPSESAGPSDSGATPSSS